MALAAQQVVAELVSRLTPVAATAGRVYPSRTWPLADADLPAWLVYVDSEPVDQQALDGDLHMHSPTIACRAVTAATADLDVALNALAAAGIAALFAEPRRWGLRLAGINRAMASQGESRLGTVTLLVQCDFIAAVTAPETILSQ